MDAGPLRDAVDGQGVEAMLDELLEHCTQRRLSSARRAPARPHLSVAAFVLDRTGRGTRVTQRELLSGVLVGLMGGVIARTKRDNARTDAGLKSRVEGSTAGRP